MKQISAIVRPRPGGGVVIRQTVELEVPAGTSLLEAETLMQAALAEAGAGMVGEFLHAGDADGKTLDYQNRRFTAKAGKECRVVECTFGAVTVSRWAYQSSRGGKCYYPLDHKMELSGSATPKLARSLAFKLAHAPAARVCKDLEEKHSRKVSFFKPDHMSPRSHSSRVKVVGQGHPPAGYPEKPDARPARGRAGVI